MKTIMITGPTSHAGKTILSMGIVRALKNRGFNVSAFKSGPDMIDREYLAQASGKSAGNLDSYLMGEDGLKKSLAMNRGDFGIIEGVMGYFDGIHNSFEHSSYDLSRKLNVPAILVYSPQGEMFSMIPKIKGMLDFPNSQIKGIILNQVSSKIYQLLKEQIEKYLEIEVLGYLPKLDGLILEEDEQQLERTIEKIAQAIEATVQIDKIIKMTQKLELEENLFPIKKRKIKVAVAWDEAFRHYYNENLILLEKMTELEYFSPLKDSSLPVSDFLYIGGKQLTEPFIRQLSENKKMQIAIKKFADSGKPILAENAGLLYLLSSIEGQPMLGLFQGRASFQKRLNLKRFGYVEIKLEADTLLGKKATNLRGNESHPSSAEISEPTIFQVKKAKTNRSWSCAYQYKNTLAYYQHIHFLGNIEAFYYLLNQIEQLKDGRK